MRNLHPEWGYLAPTPSFMHTVHVALVAMVIGAICAAAVVVSLVEPRDDNTSIAARALLASPSEAAVRGQNTVQPERAMAGIPSLASAVASPSESAAANVRKLSGTPTSGPGLASAAASTKIPSAATATAAPAAPIYVSPQTAPARKSSSSRKHHLARRQLRHRHLFDEYRARGYGTGSIRDVW
jgi:hypothetical protein